MILFSNILITGFVAIVKQSRHALSILNHQAKGIARSETPPKYHIEDLSNETIEHRRHHDVPNSRSEPVDVPAVHTVIGAREK